MLGVLKVEWKGSHDDCFVDKYVCLTSGTHFPKELGRDLFRGDPQKAGNGSGSVPSFLFQLSFREVAFAKTPDGWVATGSETQPRELISSMAVEYRPSIPELPYYVGRQVMFGVMIDLTGEGNSTSSERTSVHIKNNIYGQG